jgi:hypothetical protein
MTVITSTNLKADCGHMLIHFRLMELNKIIIKVLQKLRAWRISMESLDQGITEFWEWPGIIMSMCWGLLQPWN